MQLVLFMGRMYGKSGAKSRKTGRLNTINLSDYSQLFYENGAYMIEINLEYTRTTHLFDEKIYKLPSTALMGLFSENY